MPDHERQDQNSDPADATGFGPGVEQFQRAALDAVRAMRAMLDAAESVLADPDALESVVHTVTSMAKSAGETVVGFAAGAARAAGQADAGDKRPEDEGGGGFHRIDVE